MKKVALLGLLGFLLAQIFQVYVSYTFPSAVNELEAITRVAHPLQKMRYLFILLSIFGLTVSYIYICFQRSSINQLFALIAGFFLMLFCSIELVYRSVEFFTVQQTWVTQLINTTNENEKAALIESVKQFDGIVRGLYFPLLAGHLLGSLFIFLTTFPAKESDLYLRAAMGINCLRLLARIGGGYAGITWLNPASNQLYFPLISTVMLLLMVYVWKSRD